MERGRIISTPAEVSEVGVRFLNLIRTFGDRVIPILLPGLDTYLGPLLPGELMIIQARTHHGKSLFITEWEKRLANYHISIGKSSQDGSSGSVIGHVDTETPLQHLALDLLAAGAHLNLPDVVYGDGTIDPEAIIASARMISRTPIYPITTRTGEGDVTLTNVLKSLLLLKEGQLDGIEREVSIVFLDYLQAFPLDPATRRAHMDQQRRLQVASDVDTVRRMGSENALFCPTVLGSQAKQPANEPRTLQGTNPIQLLGMYASQETANAAQRTDRLISLTIPLRDGYANGSQVTYGSEVFTVTPSLIFVKVNKQRLKGLPAGGVFVYNITDSVDPFEKFQLLYKDTHGYKCPWSAPVIPHRSTY